MSNTRNKFSLEVRARAARMMLENEDDYSSRWAAITSISSKIGYVPQTLSSWIKRKEVDSGTRMMRDLLARAMDGGIALMRPKLRPSASWPHGK